MGGTNGKYTMEERKIARHISDLMIKKNYHRKVCLNVDMQINILKEKLKGKYGK